MLAALLNPVTLVLAGACIALTTSVGRPVQPTLRVYRAWLRRPLVGWILGSLVVAHVAARVLLGVVAPGDFAGEIVASRAWVQGAPLYSADIAADSRPVVDGPADRMSASVAALLPSWARAAVDARRHTRLVGQPHPPALVAVMVPVIALVGPTGAFLLLAAATLGAAAWCAGRLAQWVSVPAVDAHLMMLLVAAWQPVLAALRDGQWSIVVAGLCLGAWWRIRSGRVTSGGALLGCAAALKLYPALLIVPLWRASRRATVAAVFGFSAAAIAATAIIGHAAWAQYPAAALAVTAGHVHTHTNIALLARVGGLFSWPLAPACWILAGVALVGVTLVRTAGEADDDGPSSFDRAFAGFCCLSVLLSPVAWPHYVFMLSLPIAMAWTMEWNEMSRAGLSLVLAATLMLSLPATETSRIGSTFVSSLSSGFAVLRTGALLAIWWSLVRSRPATAGPMAAA